jgi:Leucine-rich repeat (LRR) protein
VFNNSWNFERLNTSESDSQSTSSILKWFMLLPLHYLYPTPCVYKELLPSLASLYGLCELDISFCGLTQLPDVIGCLCWLEELNLGGNNFVTLPSLKKLSKLVFLNLEHCKLLESLPDLPSPTAIELDQCCRRVGMYIFNCPNLD